MDEAESMEIDFFLLSKKRGAIALISSTLK